MCDQNRGEKSCATCKWWICEQEFNWSPDLNVGICSKDETQRSAREGGRCVNYYKKTIICGRQDLSPAGTEKSLVDSVVDKIVKDGTLWNAINLAVDQKLNAKFEELRYLDEMIARRISKLAAFEAESERLLSVRK